MKKPNNPPVEEYRLSRKDMLHTISKRMVILISVSLFTAGAMFSVPLIFDTRVFFFWLCLLCGIIGGFVSVQQRIKKISDSELRILSGSWFQMLSTPLYGGIFAVLLYVIFQSKFVTGTMFPEFSYPPIPATGVSSDYFIDFIRNTVPKTGEDFSKLLVWCFIAGFSERFVPRIISEIEDKAVAEEPEQTKKSGGKRRSR